MLQSPRGGGRRKRALLVSAVAALGAAGVMGQAALASPVQPPAVPDSIAVPAGNVAYLVGHAHGEQIYTCQSANGVYSWSAATPKAVLIGHDQPVFVAHHFAGPTWQAKDGSFVTATKVASVSGGAGNIPWLLLKATGTGTGPNGGDTLTATTYIQRLNTQGGVAPDISECNTHTVGHEFRVHYTADYYFYRAA